MSLPSLEVFLSSCWFITIANMSYQKKNISLAFSGLKFVSIHRMSSKSDLFLWTLSISFYIYFSLPPNF